MSITAMNVRDINNERLEPCTCDIGYTGHILSGQSNGNGQTHYTIHCMMCARTISRPTKEEAVAAWNRSETV